MRIIYLKGCFNLVVIPVKELVDYIVVPGCLVPQSATSHLEDRKIILLEGVRVITLFNGQFVHIKWRSKGGEFGQLCLLAFFQYCTSSGHSCDGWRIFFVITLSCNHMLGPICLQCKLAFE